MLSEEEEERALDALLAMLYAERGEPVPPLARDRKPDRFRALCNVRPPAPVSSEFLRLQDSYLASCTEKRGVVPADGLFAGGSLAVWRGDITRLAADAVVNACNPQMLGCFQPLHGCVDNAIHSWAGVQVRLDLARIMRGRTEPNGKVRVTAGYALPCRAIFHTVGPQVVGSVTERDERDLASCYRACIDKAAEMGLSTLAFCCISTGVYGYPNEAACAVAVDTVQERLSELGVPLRVVFVTFLEKDRLLYENRVNAP